MLVQGFSSSSVIGVNDSIMAAEPAVLLTVQSAQLEQRPRRRLHPQQDVVPRSADDADLSEEDVLLPPEARFPKPLRPHLYRL